MEEKRLWSEVQRIIRNCERRRKRGDERSRRKDEALIEEPPAMGGPRQKKYDLFMQAVEDIMRREHEVNMDITLKSDMARAFHITLAIGKYLWNKDEDTMVQRIIQSGVEQIINEYNSEVALKEAKKLFKPIVREILEELEDEGSK